jgi:hypothetical protein
MVAAIGSASVSSSYGAVSPTAGLEAQITRYQKQLADCVNCDSANTAQGKENIQEISNKISAAKAKIEEFNLTKSIGQPSQADNSINLPNTGKQSANSVTANAISQPNAVADTSGRATSGTVGTLVDVSA